MNAAQLNEALRDPTVRTIALDGDHRTLDGLDLDAVRADPKPIVGTGGSTFVHLELWRECGLVGYHGNGQVRPGPLRFTGSTGVPGRVEGVLLGGSLGPLRAMVGAGLPSLNGAILLLTGERTQGLGQVDRQLTHLIRAGALHGLRGVAVGEFAGFDGLVDRGWSLDDVLTDHLHTLGVPVLTYLPIGPGRPPVPIGVRAILDATAAGLSVG
ncbi:MAG: muramoyltetrapeptide carboxypeptidase [Actinoplanes sp.]|jgi:muramoyltetrapeptide carboxypeptidase|nr:muramoyltetrapeptide carboxypeptidase [Actinoplanes sp.]